MTITFLSKSFQLCTTIISPEVCTDFSTSRSLSPLQLIVSRCGPAASKQKGLGSIPLRISFLFTKVVVCGHFLVTLSLTINETLMSLIAARLYAGVILVVTV